MKLNVDDPRNLYDTRYVFEYKKEVPEKEDVGIVTNVSSQVVIYAKNDWCAEYVLHGKLVDHDQLGYVERYDGNVYEWCLDEMYAEDFELVEKSPNPFYGTAVPEKEEPPSVEKMLEGKKPFIVYAEDGVWDDWLGLAFDKVAPSTYVWHWGHPVKVANRHKQFYNPEFFEDEKSEVKLNVE